MCSDKELKDIEASGCNMSSEMQHKIDVNNKEAAEIREDSNNKLRSFLF